MLGDVKGSESVQNRRGLLEGSLKIINVESGEHIRRAGELFREYASSIGFDLSFQDFEKELTQLPGEYAPPMGCLLLAVYNDRIVGCVALRRLNKAICEMKRLYVRPKFRGNGIGRILALSIISETRRIGYKHMRLDTAPSLVEALSIYRSLGFREIEPYRYNPLQGARFMELTI